MDNRDPKTTGSSVECVACGQTKQPTGRDAPMGMLMCNDECPGYRCQPLPGSLWPGESREDFGYRCDAASELVGVGPEWEDKATTLTPDELTALEAVVAAMTEAPWEFREGHDGENDPAVRAKDKDGTIPVWCEGPFWDYADGHGTVALRNAAPALLAMAREMAAERQWNHRMRCVHCNLTGPVESFEDSDARAKSHAAVCLEHPLAKERDAERERADGAELHLRALLDTLSLQGLKAQKCGSKNATQAYWDALAHMRQEKP